MKCLKCNCGILEKVNGTEPYNQDHLQCNNCDSTFNIIEFENKIKKEVKHVTRKDFEDFFNQQFPYKEISFNQERTIFKITFWLDQQKEVMQYWNEKGFYKFSNLTLVFEL